MFRSTCRSIDHREMADAMRTIYGMNTSYTKYQSKHNTPVTPVPVSAFAPVCVSVLVRAVLPTDSLISYLPDPPRDR
jgi:hypothetical protein